MKRFVTILLAAMPFAGFAQDSPDSLFKPVSLHLDHYISVQVNELTKQIFAVNNTSGPNTTINPFLCNYEIIERSSQWGLRIGMGYATTSSSQSQDLGSATYSVDRKQNELNMRFGVEKLFKISDRWQCGVGADVVVSRGKEEVHYVEANSTYHYDSTSNMKLSGFGPSAMLRFGITRRIFVGTETSFYYLAGKNYVSISSGTSPALNDNNFTDKVKDGRFYLPVTFYMAIKI